MFVLLILCAYFHDHFLSPKTIAFNINMLVLPTFGLINTH